MSQTRPTTLISIALACGLSSCVHTAQVTGTVRFTDGSPVVGANVKLTDSHAAIFVMREIKKGTAVTDQNGKFRFDRVRYSHMLDVMISSRDCQWLGNGYAILKRDPTPPEAYDVQIELLRDECK